MKLGLVFSSALFGLVLGTSIALAAAHRPVQPAPEAFVPPAVTVAQSVAIEGSINENVTVMPEVTIHARPAKKVAQAKARVWTCGPWQDSNIGGRYQACEWK